MSIQNTQTAEAISGSPDHLRVLRRNGEVSEFEAGKIAVAISKAFLAVEGKTAGESTRVHDIASAISKNIAASLSARRPDGGIIHIEDIQDQVELALMRAGEHQVARSYILYREERNKAREQAKKFQAAPELHFVDLDGERRLLDREALYKTIAHACQGLSDVEAGRILEDTCRNLFDGVAASDIDKALTMSARSMIESEPNYSYVAARLLLNQHAHEAFRFLGLALEGAEGRLIDYKTSFPSYIQKASALELINEELTHYDLEALAAAIRPERDLLFNYLGIQTLYDRYFIHSADVRIELPQAFFMRVAMGLAIEEDDRTARTIEFYHLISSMDYLCSTPTLFNSGTRRSQLSSCFLSTVPDDLKAIYKAIQDNAMLSKFAGGLGNDWTPVRAMGSLIKATNGKSSGVVPFLSVANATTVAVNQGGKRKGALCSYLETWHLDIEEFLELRKNTGDERRRTHDMNTANWIPDLFMKRVMEDGQWTLFSPSDTPDLHDLYGLEFEVAYRAYEQKADADQIRHKRVQAKALWRKMLGMVFETGHPWMTFKDPCNLRSPQQHAGVIHSSNLCTEITLNTSKNEIAVCNLGSINLARHMKDDGKLDTEKLQKTIKTAVRMLDNVIDINYYSVPEARNSNMQHRPVGMGLMGFQDALYIRGTSYASDEAVEFADECMETISYYAIRESSALAVERGSYASFDGSLWSQGILPIDSIEKLSEARGDQYLDMDRTQRLDWDTLRKTVMKQGMRNSNVMAIAPTATIANICGVTQSIEPTYQNLYVKSNLSGEFTVVNPYLVKRLKALSLWDAVMVNDLKYFNGSVKQIDRIPEELRECFSTVFEVDPKWLIDAGSRRQKWLDQAQSLNLYIAEPSGKKLDRMYKHAWLKGLKTTYYLRSLGATNAEKSTITDSALNAVNSGVKACAIDDPDCEACQ